MTQEIRDTDKGVIVKQREAREAEQQEKETVLSAARERLMEIMLEITLMLEEAQETVDDLGVFGESGMADKAKAYWIPAILGNLDSKYGITLQDTINELDEEIEHGRCHD